MKNAWIAYVLMTTASSSATTTRIGNSRQNDRFLRGRRPFMPVDPFVLAARRPPAPDPACSELTDDASSSGAAPAALALAALALAALALASLALASRPALASGTGPFPLPAAPDAPDPSFALTGWPCSGTGGVALAPEPASGSAPGVTPRPAPLMSAPSDRVHRVPGPRARFGRPNVAGTGT